MQCLCALRLRQSIELFSCVARATFFDQLVWRYRKRYRQTHLVFGGMTTVAVLDLFVGGMDGKQGSAYGGSKQVV